MNENRYLELLTGVRFRSASMGYKGVTLFEEHEIPDAQMGYRVDASGQNLTGSKEGDWKDSWLVIGYEDETDDPLFVDFSWDELSVYTARHGQGTWNAERIADSFSGCVESLEQVQFVATGREEPLVALKRIQEINPHSSLGFWERLLSEDEL